MTLGAGFLGGLVTGILAGLIANWLSTLKCPRWLAGLMPVAIVPLITTLIMGLLMLMLIGHPLAALMSFLQTWLNSIWHFCNLAGDHYRSDDVLRSGRTG